MSAISTTKIAVKPRLLVVNVYFAPKSYGGAAVQAENMCRLLSSKYGWQILVVTTLRDSALPPYSLRRYNASGIDIIGVNVPSEDLSYKQHYQNAAFTTLFAQIVDAFQPDIAHFHCIQTIGIGLFDCLERARIPFAITFHDFWWLCERIFMINSNRSCCHQTKINLEVCMYCTSDIEATKDRYETLHTALRSADLFLFPSEFHRHLHLSNGLPSQRCITNKNGVKMPASTYRKSPIVDPDINLRFGFVGGPGPNKGAQLILDAFRNIERTDYELVIVDGLQNAEGSWRQGWDWSIAGKLSFYDAYNQDSIDAFYSSIDVLLYPSVGKESFGLSVREALLRDVWVVVSDAGAAAEDCVDGVNSTVLTMTQDSGPLRTALLMLFEMDGLHDFSNPHKSDITCLQQQASHLNMLLSGLVTRSL